MDMQPWPRLYLNFELIGHNGYVLRQSSASWAQVHTVSWLRYLAATVIYLQSPNTAICCEAGSETASGKEHGSKPQPLCPLEESFLDAIDVVAKSKRSSVLGISKLSWKSKVQPLIRFYRQSVTVITKIAKILIATSCRPL